MLWRDTDKILSKPFHSHFGGEKSRMVNWNALIEAPIGIMLLLVAVLMIEPLQIPLFLALRNSQAFPNGTATIAIIQLLSLILGILVIFGAYKSFMSDDRQFQQFR